ncbi:PilZ domain-containing protein [Candidatus Gracilibacteria bacterium]|nr:PilZ domain-containing protein [Candidatus Gracilibacteria bacterium]
MKSNSSKVDLTQIAINPETKPKDSLVSRHNRFSHDKLIDILGMDTPHIHIKLTSPKYKDTILGIVKDISKTGMRLLTKNSLKKGEKIKLSFVFNTRLINVEEAEVMWADNEKGFYTIGLKFNKFEEDGKLPKIGDFLGTLSKFNFMTKVSDRNTSYSKDEIRQKLEESFFDELTIKNDIDKLIARNFSEKSNFAVSDLPKVFVMLLYKRAEISADRLTMDVSLPFPGNKERINFIIKIIYTFLQSVNVQLFKRDKKGDEFKRFASKINNALFENEQGLFLLGENISDYGLSRKVFIKKEIISGKPHASLVIKGEKQVGQDLDELKIFFDVEKAIATKLVENLTLEDIDNFPFVKKGKTLMGFEGYVAGKKGVDCLGFVLPPKKIPQTPNINLKNISIKRKIIEDESGLEKINIYFVAESDGIVICKKSAKTGEIINLGIRKDIPGVEDINLSKNETVVLQSSVDLSPKSMTGNFDIKGDGEIKIETNFDGVLKTKGSFDAGSVDDEAIIEANKSVKVKGKVGKKVTISSKGEVILPSGVCSEITVSGKEVKGNDIMVTGATIIEGNRIDLTNFTANGKIIVKLGLENILARRKELYKALNQLKKINTKDMDTKIDLIISNILSLLEIKLDKEDYIDDMNKIKRFMKDGKTEEASDLYELILGRLPHKIRHNEALTQYNKIASSDPKFVSIPILSSEAASLLKKLQKRSDAQKELAEIEKILENEEISFSIDGVLSPNSSIEIRFGSLKTERLTGLIGTDRELPISLVYKYNKEIFDLKKERWKMKR